MGHSAMGQWSQSNLHSNTHKLMVVLMASHSKGKHIQVLTDNISSVACYNYAQMAASVSAVVYNFEISTGH